MTTAANPSSPWQEFRAAFRQNTGALIGLPVLVAMVLAAVFAPWLAPYDPAVQHTDAFLAPPIWQDGGSARFLLGTDDLGRDMLSRLIYGARFSLSIGLIVVLMALVTGIVTGAVAGLEIGRASCRERV